MVMRGLVLGRASGSSARPSKVGELLATEAWGKFTAAEWRSPPLPGWNRRCTSSLRSLLGELHGSFPLSLHLGLPLSPA